MKATDPSASNVADESAITRIQPALTGIPPFRTGKPAEDKYLKVVARHLRNPPPDAAQTNPGVDKELAAITKSYLSGRFSVDATLAGRRRTAVAAR